MIKFNKYHVAGNGVKARVFYSVNNRTDGRLCVTIYHRDYSDNLYKVLGNAAEYENDTDLHTDYFDKGCVRIFADHPLYPAALARAEANKVRA